MRGFLKPQRLCCGIAISSLALLLKSKANRSPFPLCISLALVRTIKSSCAKTFRLLRFLLWNRLAAVLAGTVSKPRVSQTLREIGMADMEHTAVKTGIGNDEVACLRACPLGLDFGFPHGGKSALTRAAVEVGRILPLLSGHGEKL